MGFLFGRNAGHWNLDIMAISSSPKVINFDLPLHLKEKKVLLLGPPCNTTLLKKERKSFICAGQLMRYTFFFSKEAGTFLFNCPLSLSLFLSLSLSFSTRVDDDQIILQGDKRGTKERGRGKNLFLRHD